MPPTWADTGRRLKHLVALVFLVAGLTVHTIALAATPSRDGTDEFEAMARRVAAGHVTMEDGTPIIAPHLPKQVSIVLARGFTGNILNTVTKDGYLEVYGAALQKLGFEVHFADIDTQASIDQGTPNAKALREAIVNASSGGKKVMVIGHSMAASLVATTLSKYQKQLVPHVLGVGTLEGAYEGTPGADLAEKTGLTGVARRLPLVRGTAAVMHDLTTTASAARNRKYPYPSHIPTLSITTTPNLKSPLFGLSQALRVVSRVVGPKEMRGPNDGLVPRASGILPDAVHVDLPGDHMTGVLTHVPVANFRARGQIYHPHVIALTSVGMLARMAEAAPQTAPKPAPVRHPLPSSRPQVFAHVGGPR